MSTTLLFVELVVTGIGALGFLALYAVAVFGVTWLAPIAVLDGTVLAIFVLAVAYILGILVDKLADRVLHAWSATTKARYFADDSRYHHAKSAMMLDPAAVKAYEYGRTRLRISRGWMLNSIFSLPGLVTLCLHRDGGPLLKLLIFGIILISFITYLCWYAFSSLTVNEFMATSRFLTRDMPSNHPNTPLESP